MPAARAYTSSLKQILTTDLLGQGASAPLIEQAWLILFDLVQHEDLNVLTTPQLEKLLDQGHLPTTANPDSPETRARELLTQFVQGHTLHQREILLGGYILALKARGCSKATIKNYLSDIRQIFALTDEKRVEVLLTETRLRSFVEQQEHSHLATSSIRRKLTTAAQFGKWLQAEGVLEQSTADQLYHLSQTYGKAATDDFVAIPLATVPVLAVAAAAKTPSTPISAPQLGKPIVLQNNAKSKLNQTAPSDQFLADTRSNTPATESDSAEKSAKSAVSPLAMLKRPSAGFARWLPKFSLQGAVTTLALLLSILGIGLLARMQFLQNVDQPLAYPTALTPPTRSLSFQGRLTDENQNPITGATDMNFKLYDSGPSTSGGTQLWTSGVCSVDPDQDGIFSVGLGDDCGAQITDDVFSENTSVWLQITVGTSPSDEILSPRQPIKAVAYALNSETVQGYPASASAVENTVIVMNNSGEIVLGNSSPKIKATSTNGLTLEGQALRLTTTSGSNGNVFLSPDGTGSVIATKYINAPGATLSATYAGGTPLTVKAGPSATNATAITSWQNSAGGVLGVVTGTGNVGIGTTTPNTTLELNTGGTTSINSARFLVPGLTTTQQTDFYLGKAAAVYQSVAFGYEYNSTPSLGYGYFTNYGDAGSAGVTVRSGGYVGIGTSNAQSKLGVSGGTAIGSGYASSVAAPTNGLIVEGNVGIGTSSAPNFKLEVAGNLGPSANNTYSLGSDSYRWASLYTNQLCLTGDCRTAWPATGSNYWQMTAGTLSPFSNSLDLLLGATATSSAKFAFMNVNSGTPTASISGNLALSVPTGANPATHLNIFNGGSYGIQTSVGGEAGLTERLTILNNGNVGIGTTAPTNRLEIGSITDATAIKTAVTTTTTGTAYGLRNSVTATGNIGNSGRGIGVYNDITASAYAITFGTYNNLNASAAGNSAMYGNYTNANTSSSGVNTAYGTYFITDPASTGGNQYAYYALMTSGTASKWGLYLSGEANNYLSGNVGIGTSTATGKLTITQTAAATGALKGIVYTGAVNTNQTLSTEIPSLTLTTAGRQWATGALTTQREVLVTQPVYSFVGASTITDAATVGIAGAPNSSTNATLTNAHALLIQSADVTGTGAANNSYGLTVNAQSGATNNYAAQFMGGNVGIGTASPNAKLKVVETTAGGTNLDNISSYVVTSSSGSSTGTGVKAVSEFSGTSGTLTAIQALNGVVTATGNGTGAVTYATAANLEASVSTGATITNLNMLSVNNPSNSGTITTLKGVNINPLTSGTNRWAIYQEGTTDRSYFGGVVGIGDTDPDAKLEVSANTEQLRLTYTDNSVDSKFTLDGSGNLTIDNTGTKTVIADDLQITGADILDTNGNEFLRFTAVGSAVNELTIGNAAASGVVTLAATGGDTDIALSLDAKGADPVNIAGTSTGGVNIAGSGTGDVNIAGGSGSTGCTIQNSSGNLTCTGTISGAGIVASSLKWNQLQSPDAGPTTLAHGSYSTVFNWDSLTTTTGFTYGSTSLTSGNLVAISPTNTGQTGNSLYVSSASTGAAAQGLARFNFTGAHTGNGLQIDDAGTTGNALDINANALTTGTGVDITSTSTAGGASGVSKMLNIARSGANAQLAHTAYGVYSAVTNTNATSGTNIAGYFSASGATTANYGLIVAAGNVGIGTTAPGAKLAIDTTLNDGLRIDQTVTGQDATSVLSYSSSNQKAWGAYFDTSSTSASGSDFALAGYFNAYATSGGLAYGINSEADSAATSYGVYSRARSTGGVSYGTYSNAWGATINSSYAGYFTNTATNSTTDAINKYGLYVTSTGTYPGSTGAATNNYGLYVATPTGADNNYAAIFAGGNVGIGTMTPTEKIGVAGNATISGTLALGPLPTVDAGTCDAAAKGKQYMDGVTNKMYYCNGTSWTDMTGATAKWNALTNPDGALTLAHAAYKTQFNWDTLTMTAGMGFGSTSLTSGNLVEISPTNTAQTGNSLYVSSASTGAASNGLARFNFTGAHTGNGLQVDDVTATGTGMALIANSLSTGTGFSLTSTSTALTSGGLLNLQATGAPAAQWTGDLAKIEYNSTDADVDGSALKLGLVGTSAAGSGTTLNVTTQQEGSGALALRVNDDGTYADTTPFVIDAAGNVGIGTTGTSSNVLSVSGPNTSGVTIADFQISGSTVFKIGTTDGLTLTTSSNSNGSIKNALTLGIKGGINITSEVVPVQINAPTYTITGSYANQRITRFTQPTITAASALGITTEANTVNIAGAPISAGSATIANSMALRITAGTSVASGVTNAYSLYVDAPTGATNNYAAVFNTGNVGIGDATPDALLEVLSTAEQLRLTYTDGSVDSRFTVDSSGNLTIDNTGIKTVIADDLQVNGADILDTNGNEFLRFTAVGSAVNELTIANAAASGVVTLAATGGDTDIALSIDAKGADPVNIAGVSTGDVNIAGGSGSTGCTITNSNGNLTCSGTISGTIAGTIPWSSLTAPGANQSLTMGAWTSAWTFDSLATTNYGLTMSTSTTGLTTGGGLLSLSATGAPAAQWTGDLAKIEYDSTDADVDGSALKVGLLGVSAAGSGTALNVTTRQEGSGALALRVNDDGTYADTTPFVIDAAGNVGIGTTGTTSILSVNGPNTAGITLGNFQINGSSVFTINSSNGLTLTASATGNGSIPNAFTLGMNGAANITSEVVPVQINAPTYTITGSYANQRITRFTQPTITAASALGITTEANTVNIAGAPISAGSATIANSMALRITAGTSVASGVTNAYSLYVDAPTGATNNYAAVFNTGNVGIGTTGPGFSLDVAGTSRADTPIRRTDYWTAMATFPGAVNTGSSMVYTGDNYIYATIGGGTSFYRYSISTNTWESRTAITGSVGSGAELVYTGGDYIYATRGGTTTDFYRYSISGNSWSAMTSVTGTVQIHASIAYTGGDYIYVTRGGGTTDFYRYSISGNSWSTMTAITGNSNGSSLVYTGGNYIFATNGGGTSFYRYSLSDNAWTTVAALPATVGNGGSLTYTGGNYIYATIGNNTTGYYRYSISTNTWSAMTVAPGNVYDNAALTYTNDGYIYATLGNSSTSFYRYAAGFDSPLDTIASSGLILRSNIALESNVGFIGGNIGIGDATPDVKLEILSTTEQLRLTHTDGSFDSRFTVDGSGNLTIDNTGTKTVITDDLQVDGGDIDANGAGVLNIASVSTGNVNIAGGSGATGCTVENSTGNLTCSGTIAGTIPWNSITAPTGNQSLAMAARTSAWSFDTLGTNSYGLSMTSTSTALTTGGLLNLSATGAPASQWTGELAKIEYTSTDGNVDGSALKVGLMGALAAGSGTTLNITTQQQGAGALAFRVNDEGTYADTTPFVIDAGGNVGIGTSAPLSPYKLDVWNSAVHIGNAASFSPGADTQLVLSPNSGTITGIAFQHDGSDRTFIRSTAGDAIAFGSDVVGTYMSIKYNTGNVGIGTTAPSGKLEIKQTAAATGALRGLVYTGAVNTNQTLSTEIPAVTFTTAGRQWATGSFATQREVLITQPVYSSVGATSTITDAATVGIAGAPNSSTNVALTNAHGLLIQSADVTGAGAATNSYGLTVNAQSGATNNYAAAFLGGNVGIGTSAPGARLEVSDGTDSVQIIPSTGITFVDSTGASTIQGGTGGRLNIYSGTSQDILLNSGSGKISVASGDQVEFDASSIDPVLDVNGNRTTLFRIENEWGGQSVDLYVEGNVGVGTTAPVNKLAVISTTTPQLRVGYDNTTNYFTGAVSSAGAVTFDANGASAGFTFSDLVSVTGNLTVTGHVLPGTDDLYDLGSNAARWRDIYLGGESIHIGDDTADEGIIQYTSSNVLSFSTDSTINGDIAFFTDDLYLDKSTGFVGIGTTAPGSTLEVAGNIAAKGINGFISSPYAIVAPKTLVGIGSGDLTSIGTDATGASPYGIVADPTGRFVYVVNYGPDTVQTYTINQTTGDLTSVGTDATGVDPRAIAVDPTGRFVYVTNWTDSTVQTYTINQTTGDLTSVGTDATGTNPRDVTVDPTGRFAYVANWTGATVQTYTINQTTGDLTSVGTDATGTNPIGVTVDPTGRFAYVINFNSTTVQTYTINQTTGDLNSLETDATGSGPTGIAMDPTGRFVYVTNQNATTVQTYTINQTTGGLTSVGTDATGTNPYGITVDPTGRFAYLTNNGTTTVQIYSINQTTGDLTSVGTDATGTSPYGIAIDPTGRFAYLTNNGSTTVQTYAVNNFSAGSGYFAGNVGIGTFSPTGNLEIKQTAAATGALRGLVYTGAVNTNQTLSTEIPAVTFTTAGREWATGAIALQREVLITQPTYSFVGSSTITDAATVGIAGAPIKSTNASITNTHGLLIQAGAVSTATNSYGLTVNAQTGATNNYAAAFLGGNVGIGTNAPTQIAHLWSAAGTTALRIENTHSSTGTGAVLQLASYGGDDLRGAYVQYQRGTTDKWFAGLMYNGGSANTSYSISTTNSLSASQFVINASGNVGIGSTSPNSKLRVATDVASNYAAYFFNDGNATTRWGIGVQAGEDTGAGTSYLTRFYDGDGTSIGDITFLASTGAITYGAFTGNHLASIPISWNDQGYETGTLMCFDQFQTDQSLSQQIYPMSACQGAYNNRVAGTYAAKETEQANRHIVYAVGDGSVLVTNENGPIKQGDALVSSSKTGYAMKATAAGTIIGTATADWDGSNGIRTEQLPDGRMVVVARISLYYYPGVLYPGPNTAIANTGDITLFDVGGNYSLTSTSGQLITHATAVNTGLFANLSTGFASIRRLVVAGTTSLTDLVVSGSTQLTDVSVSALTVTSQNLSVAGQSLQAYIESVVNNMQLSNATSLPSGSVISDLSVGQLQTENLTNTGSATLNEATTDTLTVNENASISGNLAVAADASIAGELRTNRSRFGELLSDTAVLGTATISGTSANGEPILDVQGSARMRALEAQVANLQDVRALTASLYDATISGTLYANTIADLDEKVAAGLKPTLLQQLIGYDPAATSSAQIISQITGIDLGSQVVLDPISLADLPADKVLIGANAGFFEQYLQVNGNTALGGNLMLVGNLNMTTGMSISGNTISFTPSLPESCLLDASGPECSTTLKIQPSGAGALDLMNGLAVLANGMVTVNGDVNFTQNITVADTLFTDLLAPTTFDKPVQVKVAGVATESGELKQSRFEIINELDAPVATISAQGKADFAGGISVGRDGIVSPDASGSATVNKTSGKAVIPAGSTQIRLLSSQIGPDTLIYVTAQGDTANQSLYIKNQVIGEAVIGFNSPLAGDLRFNWWIVE